MTQQDDAEIINTRFAPEWCVGHRKQIGTQHHQSVDSNLHMFMKKPSRQLAAQQNNGPLCHNVAKTPNRSSKKWCETHENAHLYVSRPRLLVVTECEDPLRQLHYSKDGVYVTSTGNASEWCMAHVESHGTHDHPHLDQSTSERSLRRTLSEKALQFNCKLFFRCANPIMILQEGAQIISRRFAPEWCVVALTTTCSTSSSINGPNLHMFIAKLSMVHCAPPKKLHATIVRQSSVAITLATTALELWLNEIETPGNAHPPRKTTIVHRTAHWCRPCQSSMLRCANSSMRNKVLKSSTHALLRSGALFTPNNMERTIIHLWTTQHPNGHWSALYERRRHNSTINFFRCDNPIMIDKTVPKSIKNGSLQSGAKCTKTNWTHHH